MMQLYMLAGKKQGGPDILISVPIIHFLYSRSNVFLGCAHEFHKKVLVQYICFCPNQKGHCI